MKSIFVSLLALIAVAAQAGTIQVNVTSPSVGFTPTGTRWALEFQLADGDGIAINNSVSISGFFSSNITLDNASLQSNGLLSGTLGSTLVLVDDPSAPPPFTDFYIEFTPTLANAAMSMNFLVSYSENGTGIPNPDQFSFYLYEVLPAFQSVNSLGNGTLLEVTLTAAPIVSVFPADIGNFAPTAEAVPEPGTLLSVGLVAGLCLARKRLSR